MATFNLNQTAELSCQDQRREESRYAVNIDRAKAYIFNRKDFRTESCGRLCPTYEMKIRTNLTHVISGEVTNAIAFCLRESGA
jgi:hypothetical protein